ncbi:MAG: S8 family peptidase [Pseudomonadota bacterium]
MILDVRLIILAPLAGLVLSGCSGGGGGSSGNEVIQGTGPISPRFSATSLAEPEPSIGSAARAWETAEYFRSGGLNIINAAGGYAARTQGRPGGAGVRVGVLDDGIDSTNPDLGAVERYSTVNYDWTEFDTTTGGHGSHVAGIIGARRDGYGVHGLAYNAELVDFTIAAPQLVSGQWGSDDFVNDVRLALLSAAGLSQSLTSYGYGSYPTVTRTSNPNARVDVVNMSFGSDGRGRYRVTMRDAADAGLIMVASLGNNSSYGPSRAPADLMDDMRGMGIGVAALDSTGTRLSTRAGSNSCGWLRACLAAPGERILSTTPNQPNADFDIGYDYASGTSMAAPHVVGAVALAIAAFPGVERRDIVTRVLETADDIGAPGWDTEFGYGRLNVEAMMSPVGPTAIPTSTSVGGPSLSPNDIRLESGPGGTALAALGKAGAETLALDDMGFPFVHSLHGNVRNHRRDTQSALEAFIGPATGQQAVVDFPEMGARVAIFTYDNTALDYGSSWDFRQNEDDPYGDLDFQVEASFAINDTLRLGFSNTDDFLAETPGSHATLVSMGLLGRAMSDVDPIPFSGDGETMRLSQSLSKQWQADYAFHNGDGYSGDARTTSFAASLRRTGERLEMAWKTALVDEQDAVLGTVYDGLANNVRTQTMTLGMDMAWTVAQGVTLSGGYTIAQSDPSADGLMGFDTHLSDSASVAASFANVFTAQDRVTFIAQLPFATRSGSADVTLPTARTADGTVEFTGTRISTAATDREQNIQALYTRPIMDDRGSLGVGAFHRVNADHIRGASDTGAAFRIGWQF